VPPAGVAVHGHFRLTKADAAIGGVTVAAHTRLMLGWGRPIAIRPSFRTPRSWLPGAPT